MLGTSYRKTGTRKFYKIYEDKRICAVLVMEDWASIDFGVNRFKWNDLMEDNTRKSEVCTEQEFNTAYKTAYDRITLQRLDI